ncbi:MULTISPECIES: putative lipid II flippase FtsW [unclassified Arthrobacter]|jgi:cell division protein FtsW|uniref:putative lipid II flippase FtsW n=1 Tax=unclassified Arthrobacter TaxID=235627 RepID=UPI0009A77EE4|nr:MULTISPECIES: putative lipid II flippase FtsW [unclassified Arthrobacter]MDF2048386.1 putative lipid II flippase FtsW [Arthrobacter sp. Cr_A7]RDV10590.1 putative lipid II flippase FtsW [Arthrobacter sp. RT-1]SLK05171.1 cell division-specific peptidoglycan biosynthesis regulator FtsW [Arthrobacter sp. P2b]
MVSTPTRPQPEKQQARKQGPGSTATSVRPPATLPARLRTMYRRFWSALEGNGTSRNGSTYYLILGSTLALTAIGIMMVLSASSVESIAAGKSPYGDALKQGMFAGIGIFTMFALSRINVVWLKRLAWLAIIAAVVLLGLVQLVGAEVNGNKNWIDIGGITFQPSEASKLALALWMATVLARKGRLLSRWQHVAVPAVPMAIIIVVLVLVGNDLGTAMIIMMITAAALFFAGAPLYLFGIAGLVAVAGTAVMAVTSSNRMCRITSWWTGESCADGIDANYQATNGLYGLASGGWFGVGLGQSRQKYSWIPEAHNDFIFAIIGEELGLVGTVVVLILFAILGAAIYRVVVAQEDMFHRVLAGTIMVWLLGQATVNMSVVTGLMPVIGVPLPFISYGGSALLMSLCAIGVVLSLAREQMAPAIRPKKMLKFKAKGRGTAPKKKTARKRA